MKKKYLLYKLILFIFTTLLLSTSCAIYHNPSQKFDTLMGIIDSEYIKELNNSKITNEAIQKVLTKLDSHSRYLNSNDLKNYLITTSGEYGGIGISMYMHKSILTISYTYPDSPAKKYGILPGDIILKINGHSTLGLSLDTCSNLANGRIGEVLQLTIIRKSEKRPFLFKIKREKIKTDPIKSKVFDNHILYVKIPIFNNNTSHALKKILKKNIPLQGIILDLRSNPGGILNEAVSIVDMFIDKGLIVSQKGRNKDHTKKFMAHKTISDTQTSIAILINASSASASEIVAGTLKVYKRATIIGEKSYGKGTVQSLFSLSDNTAIKLTTAKYYLPNGKCIDKIGITPNIAIKAKYSTEKGRYTLSEKKLKQILRKIDKGTLKTKLQKQKLQKEKLQKKIKIDKTIKKAIQVLEKKYSKN